MPPNAEPSARGGPARRVSHDTAVGSPLSRRVRETAPAATGGVRPAAVRYARAASALSASPVTRRVVHSSMASAPRAR